MAELPLSFEVGLDESQEDSLLREGTASLLENWVPEPNGGLRCRRAWSNTSTTSAPATRRARGIGFFSLDNQPHDVDVKAGSFAARTSLGSTQVTGVGFQPKALILFTAGDNTATGFANSFSASVGFVTSTTDRYSVSAASENGAAASNTSRRMAQKALTVVNPGEAVDGEYDLTSFDADGFTLDCTDAFANAIIINYIAIGGADLTNAKVVKWDNPTSATTKAITGVGFTPSVVLHTGAGGGSGAALPATSTGAEFWFGAMDSSGNQWTNGFVSNDGAADANTQRFQRTDSCLAWITSGLAFEGRASYSSMDADGFTVSFASTRGAADTPCVSLALKVSSSGRMKVGSFNKDTGAAPDSQTVTGVGFTPTGVLLSSWGRAASSSAQTHSVWAMGATSGAGAEKSIAIRDEDTAATMDAEGYQNDFPLSILDETGTSTLDAQLDFSSFDADGFTGSWSPNDADADEVVYFAIGGITGAGIDRVLVAQNDTTNFDIYTLSTSQLTSGTWSVVDSNITVADPLPAVDFANGLGQTLYTHKKFSLVRRYDGTTAATIAGSPPGRAIEFHKNRFFSGGSEANPTRLWYSDLASYTTWGATSYIDIGRDDGEAIEDLAVFENGLLIAKRNSLWFLSGSSPDEFAVQPLNAGGGHAGRCIVPTPYGAVIAGREHVWQWGGGGVENISKPIEESYSVANADLVSTAYIDGETYICDENTGTMFVVDMQRGSWRTEKLASPTTEGPAIIAAKSDKLYYGPQEATTMSLLAYKELPGSSRTIDAALGITYKAWTPELWPVPPGNAMTPLHLDIKYRQRGATGAGELSIIRVYNGTTLATLSLPLQAAAGTYRESVMVGDNAQGKGINSSLFKFEHTVGVGENITIDLEEVILHYEDVGLRRG